MLAQLPAAVATLTASEPWTLQVALASSAAVEFAASASSGPEALLASALAAFDLRVAAAGQALSARFPAKTA